MSRHGLTIATGSIQQSRAHVTTDADRDRYLASVHASDTAGVITRPSGEARRLEQSGDGWTARQATAARLIRMMWRQSLPERAHPMGYPSEVCKPHEPKGEDCRSEEDVEKARTAYARYQSAVADVERRCGARSAHLIRTVAYEDAVPLRDTRMCNEALDFLGDILGLRR